MNPPHILPLALFALIIPYAAQAEEVAFHQNFSVLAAGEFAEKIPGHYTWSEFPHPLNPTIVDTNGDRALCLNSPLAYPERGGSTVTTLSKYQAVADRITYYANVSFGGRPESSLGILLKLNKEYAPLWTWDAVLTPHANGIVELRIDETEAATGIRRTLLQKSLSEVSPSKPIAIGLRISRTSNMLEVLIAREPVAEVRITKNLAELPDVFCPGVFAFNGQEGRFDDLTLILDETVQP